MSDKTRGLYSKYLVERREDPCGKHAECSYFVLDVDHDQFAAPALRAYADACSQAFPDLARDLRCMAWSIDGDGEPRPGTGDGR